MPNLTNVTLLETAFMCKRKPAVNSLPFSLQIRTRYRSSSTLFGRAATINLSKHLICCFHAPQAHQIIKTLPTHSLPITFISSQHPLLQRTPSNSVFPPQPNHVPKAAFSQQERSRDKTKTHSRPNPLPTEGTAKRVFGFAV
mgnify:CR=1 FL=1